MVVAHGMSIWEWDDSKETAYNNDNMATVAGHVAHASHKRIAGSGVEDAFLYGH